MDIIFGNWDEESMNEVRLCTKPRNQNHAKSSEEPSGTYGITNNEKLCGFDS